MKDDELLEKISNYPALRKRIAAIVQIAENEDDPVKTADEVEEKVIEAVRQLGRDLLLEWSLKQSSELNAAYEKQEHMERDGKKNSTGTAVLAPLK